MAKREFPIHMAVREGHAEVVQLPLQAGADPGQLRYTYNSWDKLFGGTRESHILFPSTRQCGGPGQTGLGESERAAPNKNSMVYSTVGRLRAFAKCLGGLGCALILSRACVVGRSYVCTI